MQVLLPTRTSTITKEYKYCYQLEKKFSEKPIVAFKNSYYSSIIMTMLVKTYVLALSDWNMKKEYLHANEIPHKLNKSSQVM